MKAQVTEHQANHTKREYKCDALVYTELRVSLIVQLNSSVSFQP